MAHKVQEHLHKLRRHVYPNKTKIYFCTDNCAFKIEVSLALGREVACNICGEPFRLSSESLRLKEPHCQKCGRVEVKNADGTKTYRKKIANKVLGDVAAANVANLEDRLHTLTRPAEDDI